MHYYFSSSASEQSSIRRYGLGPRIVVEELPAGTGCAVAVALCARVAPNLAIVMKLIKILRRCCALSSQNHHDADKQRA